MAEIQTVIDTLPDNDSFLPRYLIVQLLGILAEKLGPKNLQPKTPLTKQNQAFISAFQEKTLFSPLTYSIFWRENTTKVLADPATQVDAPDQYNRVPLTLAIANEDFVLAKELIAKGAMVLLEEKLVLEIVLISMIQRDANIISNIITEQSGPEFYWVKEYLEYLQSYVTGQPQKTNLKYHDVLNPPIRHFGQILDTLTYFNGLPSHYGFLSPSIDVLYSHLELYTKDLTDSNAQTLFTNILRAYSFTKEACNYYANLPTNSRAAETLTTQISKNIKNNSKEVVVLFGGWAGSSVALSFVNKNLIFSNLGIGGSPEAGTKIYNITNPDAITTQMVDDFIRGLGNAASPVDILASLSNIINPTPIQTIQQAFNPIDNCIFVNPRAIIQGILMVLSGNTAPAAVADMYSAYVNSLYKYSTSDLAKSMRNRDLLQNKRVECCALALEYINQHYTEPQALPRCIELKNALEFVGLKDFYFGNIAPAAQAAIQEFTIHQQEATAVNVISQENAMAKQG